MRAADPPRRRPCVPYSGQVNRCRYRSKVDAWLAILLIALTPALIFNKELRRLGSVVAALPESLLVLTITFAVFLLIERTTWYEIGSDDLLIQCLFSRIRIPLNEIVSVRQTRNPRSSPALSLDRLSIERQEGRSVRISPRRRDDFLKDLALRAALKRESDGLRR